MRTIRKERYRIARETKFLQLQEAALKNENIDLRDKINELLIAKLQRGPLQSIENITNGVSSPIRPPQSTSQHQGQHLAGRASALTTAGPTLLGRNATPHFRETVAGHDRAAHSSLSHSKTEQADSKGRIQKDWLMVGNKTNLTK